MRVAIVGPCGSGKTTLVQNLRARGIAVEECGQEHSDVRTMWQQITRPDILVFLDVSIETLRSRLEVDWEQEYLDRMNQRLAHARSHANLTLDTNRLTPEQVCDHVADYIKSLGEEQEG